MLGSLDTFALSGLVTGSVKVAGAVVEVLSKTVLYDVHERVWLRILWAQT